MGFSGEVSMLRAFAESIADRIGRDKVVVSVDHKIWIGLDNEETVRVYISPKNSRDSVSFSATNMDALEREYLNVAIPKIERWFGMSSGELAQRPEPSPPREQPRNVNVGIAVVNVRQRASQSWGEWLFGV